MLSVIIETIFVKYTLPKKKKKKKETQHVIKYKLLQIFNIPLNTEISITMH